jgi:hypothetical protein
MKDGNEDLVWINPLGGLGDTLMLSGVLKRSIELFPERRYALARRVKYASILEGHPAISRIGYPPVGARIISTDYWAKETLGGGGQRAFQVLARAFGLPTPVSEELFVPDYREDIASFVEALPRRKRNVLVSPFSDSPRKVMSLGRWEALLELLKGEDRLFIQVGRSGEPHVRGAYSIAGLTSPRQILSLVARADLVIGHDSFLMHAAHLHRKPAIILWGPTDPAVYGYDEQNHFRAAAGCASRDACLGPASSEQYARPCDRAEGHCMEAMDLTEIVRATRGLRAFQASRSGNPG